MLDRQSASTAPLVRPLRPAPTPARVFQQLCGLPHCIFLDSALRNETLGRYSFVAADPFSFLSLPPDHGYPFERVNAALDRFRSETLPELPPFQGGAAGLLSYDLSRSIESIRPPRYDEFQVPGMALGLYDVVVAFDHQEDLAWIVSQGFPETQADARIRRSRERADFFSALLSQSSGRRPDSGLPILTPAQLSPAFRVDDRPVAYSNLSAERYLSVVRRAIEYIHAGDIFQVNLAQRLLHPATSDSIALYLRLRDRNPAPFASYFDLGETQIVSASPERFLNLRGRELEARPIKGTRQRIARPEADLFSGEELRASQKDVAENVMIVDLMRNDLSRVCDPESVRVTQLCRLESYEYVQHLVSAVRGRLVDGAHGVDALQAAFPGGSITGAPKVRAMEIISELEPTARGAYCGSLGYIGFDGTMDWNILIRTITAARGWWQFPVGGGIVAQSDPEAEYQETWHKAEGTMRAL